MFSLALDEASNVSDNAQVLIYIRGVDQRSEVYEQRLDINSIHSTTTTENSCKTDEDAAY